MAVDTLGLSIGNTPLLELKGIAAKLRLPAQIFAKAEWHNQGGSVKDRAALFMIEGAEGRGILQPGGTIIEATSCNTVIALSYIGRAKGYKAVIVMPDTMSIERQEIMRSYGAEVVLTDGKNGMKGAIEKAAELKSTIPDAWIAGQFENLDNAEAHYYTTAPEILSQLPDFDCFVSGVGTGGTITGCGRAFREKGGIDIVAVEPKESAVLSGRQASPHALQGIGAGFVPKVLDVSLIDDILCVSKEQAFGSAKMLIETDGLKVGISSGAALHACIICAMSGKYKRIVTVFPDNADKYKSVEGFY